MSSFLAKLFSKRQPKSGAVAKERLQLVLLHDRSNLTAEEIRAMKDEILQVIARYVDFDPAKVEIDLRSDNRETMLRAEIPIEPAGRRRRPASQQPVSATEA
ncbi:MAG: cell division topological specificity factor MinE [Anaerolineae bacterium]